MTSGKNDFFQLFPRAGKKTLMHIHRKKDNIIMLEDLKVYAKQLVCNHVLNRTVQAVVKTAV